MSKSSGGACDNSDVNTVLNLIEVNVDQFLALGGLAGGRLLGVDLVDQLIGGTVGWASLAALAAGYRRLRKREGLGRGDAKLLGAVGLWLGWMPLAPILALAAALGLAVALRRGLSAGDAIPFDR